jgi:DNA ligase-1
MAQLLILFICIFLIITPLYVNSKLVPPELMLAKTTNLQSIQLSYRGYLVSEKLDGVRGFWNGKHLLTRTGKLIHAPAWFTHDFPTEPLEGELWIRRGQFDLVSGIIRKQTPVDAEWKKIKFMLFDSPESELIFSQRLNYIQTLISPLNIPWLKLIEHKSFTEFSQLKTYFESIVNQNGEGLMLNKGDAYYQSGRTNNIQKLKPYLDEDAIVLSHLTGKGKFQNMMGALLVKNKQGIEFKIGSGFTTAQRQHPPKIGTIISYRHSGVTKTGLPRFPTFIRIRTDLEAL